jgi:ATP-dependent Clp protease ATP-binding subunit ClpA
MAKSLEMVRSLGHEIIEPMHILWGLVEVDHSSVNRFFKDNGLATSDTISDYVQSTLGRRDAHSRLHTPFSASSKQVLDLALEQKSKDQDKFVFTNHILLGILNLPGFANSNDILKPICDSPQLLSKLENLSKVEKESENSIRRSRDEVLKTVIKLAKSDLLWESKAAADLAFLKISPQKIREMIERG